MTPFEMGVAALLRSHFPSLTAAEISRAMTAGTFYKPSGGASNGSGYGTVDAAKAIAGAAIRVKQRASMRMGPR